MKKTNVLWVILALIFLIIFNAFFFTLGNNSTEHNTSVWISYGFIHFAYLMLLITPKLIRKGKSYAIFGFSLYSISATYFLIEFVTGVVFILLSPKSSSAAFLVQICIAGLYGIIFVSHMLANEHTANTEEKRQSQIEFVKEAATKIKILLENTSDKETKKKIEQIYDTIYSSPIKSNPKLAQIEDNILQDINKLACELKTENKEFIMSAANSLLSLIKERNNLLMNNN